GVYAPLPFLNFSRNLARTAIWSATHCESNDVSAAVSNLFAVARLGRNQESPPTILGYLANLSIQQRVFDAVAASTSEWAGDKHLSELFNTTDYYENLHRAMLQEAENANQSADAAEKMSQNELAQFLKDNSGQDFPPMDPAQYASMLRQN